MQSVGEHFGAATLLSDEPRKTTVTALTDLTLLALSKANFLSLIGSVEHIVRREGQRRQWYSANSLREVSLRDFEVGRTLGCGAYGRVRLVYHRQKRRAYVLKSMKKTDVVLLRQEAHVSAERTILASVDHAFIVRLAASFQDEMRIFMLMEPLMGGELTLHMALHKGRKLGEPSARFYAGCITCALAYLHSLKIAYRDLKPENIVLDAEGYAKLVDFGFAKTIEERAWTLCGTPEFMAPEVVAHQGHGTPVDWWGLGVLVHEMVTGVTPFVPPYAETDTGQDFLMKVYALATRSSGVELSFPRFVGDEARDLISRLLAVSPAQRIGAKSFTPNHGAADVKAHPFFQMPGNSLHFEKLEARELRPPFVPKGLPKYDDIDGIPPPTETQRREEAMIVGVNIDKVAEEVLSPEDNILFRGEYIRADELLAGKVFPDF